MSPRGSFRFASPTPGPARRPGRIRSAEAPLQLSVLQGLVGNAAVTRMVQRAGISKEIAARIEGYAEVIDRIAAEEGFPPELVKGIMAAESGGVNLFDKGAKGAIGLMQVKVSSAEKGQTAETLKDEETNVRQGIRMFQRKIQAVEKAVGIKVDLKDPDGVRLMMIAYNAGEGTVMKAVKYAAEAGDPKQWYAPQHFQRALLFYGAYQGQLAVTDKGGELYGADATTLATALAGLTGGTAADLAKQTVKDLKSRLSKALEQRRLDLRKRNLTLDGLQSEPGGPLIAYALATKQRRQSASGGYLDKIERYRVHFGGASAPATATGSSAAPVTTVSKAAGPSSSAFAAPVDLGSLVASALGSVASLPGAEALIAGLLRNVAPSAITILVSLGVRDETVLSNLVFWANHPAMAGRKIARGDDNHAAAWRRARDSVVRPALAAAKARAEAQAHHDPTAPAQLPGPTPTTTDGTSASAPTSAGPVGAAPAGGFVEDPMRTTLEMLPPAVRKRFEGIQWHRLDYPGAKEAVDGSKENLAKLRADSRVEVFAEGGRWYIRGAHQKEAEAMLSALAGARPGGGERRANTGTDAVLTAEQFAKHEDEYDEFITSQLQQLQGQSDKMNKHAAEAFGRLRTTAAADGVTISVRDAFRPRATAKKSAAKSGNRKAVASYSSHSLGLAMDLNLHTKAMGEKWKEASTKFTTVTRMLGSPAYKWMYLRGAEFGFYQYRREPWHWEYNPPGFAERFFAEKPDLLPV